MKKIITIISITLLSLKCYSQNVDNKDVIRDYVISGYVNKNGEERNQFKNELISQIERGGIRGGYAKELLQTIEAKEALGIISNVPLTYEENLQLAINGDSSALLKELKARGYVKKELGIKKNSEEEEFLEFLEAKQIQGETDKNKIIQEFLDAKAKKNNNK